MKKIIIIAETLISGGTEVSLLNTIKELKKYDVEITLALLKKEGVYLNNIPKDIPIIEILREGQGLKNRNINIMEKIKVKIVRRLNLQLYYKMLLKIVDNMEEKFDLAIDFHGYGYFGTPYTIEKINADKKVMFIHDQKIDWMKNVKCWVNKFDKIFCVSEACKDSVKKEYPVLEEKIDIFRNIIDEEKVKKLAEEKIEKLSSKINLLTIGRLEYQKGYDLLIDIAKELDKNQFTWYIIGEGSLYKEIQEKIIEDNLQNNVILLGMRLNPYPYIKQCDIYVQPSRHEGYGIAIAEARCLSKPIIATNLACIKEQIKDGQTGILCGFDKDNFFDKINELILNEEKRAIYSNNLEKEKFMDSNDIEKLLIL